MARFDLWPHYEGSYDKVIIDFFEALFIVYNMTEIVLKSEQFSYFSRG